MSDKKNLVVTIASLTELEKKVYDAMVKAVFSSTDQFDISEAQRISGVSGNRFSGVISSLHKKGLYDYVGFDGYDGFSNHPTKVIYDEISPKGYKVRTDIGYVAIEDED